jgi:hypothetical protein
VSDAAPPAPLKKPSKDLDSKKAGVGSAAAKALISGNDPLDDAAVHAAAGSYVASAAINEEMQEKAGKAVANKARDKDAQAKAGAAIAASTDNPLLKAAAGNKRRCRARPARWWARRRPTRRRSRRRARRSPDKANDQRVAAEGGRSAERPADEEVKTTGRTDQGGWSSVRCLTTATDTGQVRLNTGPDTAAKHGATGGTRCRESRAQSVDASCDLRRNAERVGDVEALAATAAVKEDLFGIASAIVSRTHAQVFGKRLFGRRWRLLLVALHGGNKENPVARRCDGNGMFCCC